VGLTSSQVDEADFAFISHAHYDHMLGADTIATNTGATIVGSYETARVLRANDVPSTQVLPVSGGETIDCGHDVRVRVFPSLHSCLFARSNPDSGAECIGDLGISHQDRMAAVSKLFEMMPTFAPDLAAYLASTDAHCSRNDGGQLNYLLETPDGSILVSASSGYWVGIMRDLRPDVAILALAGRPNVNGEPHQGSLAQFLVEEVELLRPRKVIFCHHDPLLPPLLPGVDTGEAIASLAREPTYARHVELPCSEPVPVLG
ncbi:MAG TPA: MBL fold metallo-hydrolase, partial [Acidimicrobiales bacterium]|nr:MBL fold metallo-hydrolase [Acidimicrobiales bacterium]